MAEAARDQCSGGPQQPQPHHPGLGQLLPHGGGIKDVPQAWTDWMFRRAIATSRHTHPTQVLGMAQQPLLGQAEPEAKRPLGVWRQSHRALPAEVQVVHDRATPAGERTASPDDPASTHTGGYRRKAQAAA